MGALCKSLLFVHRVKIPLHVYAIYKLTTHELQEIIGWTIPKAPTLELPVNPMEIPYL